MIEKGHIVVRNSYGGDYYFVVTEVMEDQTAKLSCVQVRLSADAPIEDLELVSKARVLDLKKLFKTEVDYKLNDVLKERKQARNQRISPGKVLHVDADEGYLNLCLHYYNLLSVPAVGWYIPEASQPLVIGELLHDAAPDIAIITGHDGIKKSGEYKTSPYFIETVKKARQIRTSKDDLIIFAGACQSDYKNLVEAGANFASSPNSKMIHALDPVFLAEKLSFSYFGDILAAEHCIDSTITGVNGIGGIDTRGTLRKGHP